MGRVSHGWRRVVLVAGLLAAGGFVYGPTLDAPFFSDDYQIAGLFRDPAAGDGAIDVGRVLADFHMPWFGLRQNAYYRPLLTVSAAIDWTVWGGDPFGFHLTNLLAHVLSAVLVGLVLEEILGPRARGAGALAGFLFLLHPAGPESVAWIAGRVNALTFVPLLAAVWFHLRAGRTGRRGDRVASLAGLVAALLCKEAAVLFPVLAVAVDVGRRLARDAERRDSFDPRSFARSYRGAVAVLAVYFAARVLLLDLPLLPHRFPSEESFATRLGRLVPALLLPIHPDAWRGMERWLGGILILLLAPPLVVRLRGAPGAALASLGLPLGTAAVLALPALALALGEQLEGTRLLYESSAAVAVAMALVLSPTALPLARREGVDVDPRTPFADPRAPFLRIAALGLVLLYGTTLRGNLEPWREGAAIVREVGRALVARSGEAAGRASRLGLMSGPTPLLEAARPAHPIAILEAPYQWKGVPLLHANVLTILARPPFREDTAWLYPMTRAGIEGDASLLSAVREAGIPLAGWSLRTDTIEWKTQPVPFDRVLWDRDSEAAADGAVPREATLPLHGGGRDDPGEPGTVATFTLGEDARGSAITVTFSSQGGPAAIHGGRFEAVRVVVRDPDRSGRGPGGPEKDVDGSRELEAGEVTWSTGEGDPLRSHRRVPLWFRPVDGGRFEGIAVPSRSLLWSLESRVRHIEIRWGESLRDARPVAVELAGRLPALPVVGARLRLEPAALVLAGSQTPPERIRATFLGGLGDRTRTLERVASSAEVGSAVYPIEPDDLEFLEVTLRFGGPPLAVLIEVALDPADPLTTRARSRLLLVRVD